MIQDCSVAEWKFEIAARAVYVDVPCVEYVGERLQDRPELEFVIVVFYIFCDFCADALDLERIVADIVLGNREIPEESENAVIISGIEVVSVDKEIVDAIHCALFDIAGTPDSARNCPRHDVPSVHVRRLAYI